MPYKSLLKSDAVARYINVDCLHETDLQKRLRAETQLLPNGHMQISPDQGAFLSMLVGLMGVKKALEIGTFTGYSALCVATAMPADGRMICCDVSDQWTSIGRKYWKEAGVDAKIDLRLAPAMDTLLQLLQQNAAGAFDMIFIDADKEAYDAYYETSLKLLRVGGLILMDNMLDGRADSAANYDPVNGARHALNMKICNDSRVEAIFVMVGGGFLLARKKSG